MFSTRADTTKLERLFGSKPKTSLREGLAREWEWMQKFVQTGDEEKAIKAEVQPIAEVDEAALAEAKADAKGVEKGGPQSQCRQSPQVRQNQPSTTFGRSRNQ